MARVKPCITLASSFKFINYQCDHSSNFSLLFNHVSNLYSRCYFHQARFKSMVLLCDYPLVHSPLANSSKSFHTSVRDIGTSDSKYDYNSNLNKFPLDHFTLQDENLHQPMQSTLNSSLLNQETSLSSLSSAHSRVKESFYSKVKKNRAKVMAPLFEKEVFDKLVNLLITELDATYNEACLIIHYFKYFKPCYLTHTGVSRLIATFDKVLQFCKLHFSKNDILECHHILTMRLETLQSRVESLEEFGIKEFKPSHILNFFSLISYSESDLRKMGVIDEDTHIIQNMLNSLSSLSSKEKAKIEQSLNKTLSVSKSKSKICKAYFELRFKTSSHFAYISEIIKVPVARCHQAVEGVRRFDFSNIQALTYLRSLFFFNLKDINFLFNEFSQIYGDQLLKILLTNVQFTKHSFSLAVQNVHLVKNKYKLSDKQIELFSQNLFLETEKLENRLDYILSKFGSKALKLDNFLGYAMLSSSVVDQKLKKNQDEINLFDLDSVLSLVMHKKAKLNPKPFNHMVELAYFLSQELNVESQLIKKQLISHPFRSYLNLDDSKKVWEYLLSLKDLSKKQLINGAVILIYDVNLVKNYFTKFKASDDFQDWINHDMLLNYVIYLIEKDHKMNGSGALIGKLSVSKPEKSRDQPQVL